MRLRRNFAQAQRALALTHADDDEEDEHVSYEITAFMYEGRKNDEVGKLFL